MEDVLYLVRSLRGNGLIAVSEAEDEFIDGWYGNFFISYREDEGFAPQYNIKAIYNGNQVGLTLSRVDILSPTGIPVDSYIYRVDAPFCGGFFFKLKKEKRCYVGKDECLKGENVRLAKLVSLNVYLEEEACIRHNFFFVGK